MDAEYLKENIGASLSKALAACSVARPEDPIEYIAFHLIQSVKNRDRESELRNEAKELLDQQRKYEENLRFEAERVAEEKRKDEEVERNRLAEIERQRLVQYAKFEGNRQDREREIREFQSSQELMDEKGKRKSQFIMFPWKTRLGLFVQHIALSSYKEDLLMFINSLTPTDTKVDNNNNSSSDLLFYNTYNILKAALFLLGFQKKQFLYKWDRTKRTLKHSDIQKIINDYSPLHRQPVKKFPYVAGALQHVDIKLVEDSKPPLILILIFQWAQLCLDYRKEALRLKTLKTGVENPVEEPIDPDTLVGEDDHTDENEEEEDQEEIEPFLEPEESEGEESDDPNEGNNKENEDETESKTNDDDESAAETGGEDDGETGESGEDED